MKMRFEAKCPRCRVGMTVGAFAVRMYGGYWHTQCAIDYKRLREQQKRNAR